MGWGREGAAAQLRTTCFPPGHQSAPRRDTAASDRFPHNLPSSVSVGSGGDSHIPAKAEFKPGALGSGCLSISLATTWEMSVVKRFEGAGVQVRERAGGRVG